MNKLIFFFLLYFCTFLLESVISYFVLLFYISDSDYRGCFRAVAMWDLWRLTFYGLPFIILYFLVFKYFRNIRIHKPLSLSLFNLFAYVSFSFLSKVIWGNVPLPPEGIMFWTACVAIFISPLILGQITYFRKLMDRL